MMKLAASRRTSHFFQLLERHWTPPGVHLPQAPLDPEVAAIIRITGGNFRLLNCLLTQMERFFSKSMRYKR